MKNDLILEKFNKRFVLDNGRLNAFKNGVEPSEVLNFLTKAISQAKKEGYKEGFMQARRVIKRQCWDCRDELDEYIENYKPF